jgi:hypothetical protein
VQEEKNAKIRKNGSTPDHHSLMSAQILDDQGCFLSKAFLIRYCEEEVEINDIALFRCELDVEPEYLSTEFLMDIDLYFSDLSNLGGPEKWASNVSRFESEAVYKKVSSQTFRISKLAQGICEFVPCTF